MIHCKMRSEIFFVSCAASCGTLDCNIVKCGIKIREMRCGEIENVSCQTSNSCARFHDYKFGWTVKNLPDLFQLASEQTAKNRMNVNAGEVVGEARAFFVAVISVIGIVETRFHVVRKSDWAVCRNARGEFASERSFFLRRFFGRVHVSSRCGFSVNISIT